MRPIDADKLIEDAELRYVKVGARSNGKSILTLAKIWLLNEVESAPTIEAKPVVHAHWKKWGCEGTVCSNCYGRVLYECDEQEKKSKYCPHCGAQMDELVSNTDELKCSEKPNSSVKIPVISMEDVPNLAKEMEK